MKKISLLLMVICLALVLLSCAKPHQFKFEERQNEIEKIEIVFNPQYEPQELIKTLNSEEKDLLLSELAKIEFKKGFGDQSSLLGYCIKITFTNQEFKMIGQEGNNLNTYDTNRVNFIGWWFCDKTEWNALISRFVNVEI